MYQGTGLEIRVPLRHRHQTNLLFEALVIALQIAAKTSASAPSMSRRSTERTPAPGNEGLRRVATPLNADGFESTLRDSSQSVPRLHHALHQTEGALGSTQPLVVSYVLFRLVA